MNKCRFGIYLIVSKKTRAMYVIPFGFVLIFIGRYCIISG